ncbi:MAG TPA: hypothetical protein DEB39_04505 [Planctomycetaceae bacterium]|nr:hypothetical protein [Planctomycetaceae bacterium]
MSGGIEQAAESSKAILCIVVLLTENRSQIVRCDRCPFKRSRGIVRVSDGESMALLYWKRDESGHFGQVCLPHSFVLNFCLCNGICGPFGRRAIARGRNVMPFTVDSNSGKDSAKTS